MREVLDYRCQGRTRTVPTAVVVVGAVGGAHPSRSAPGHQEPVCGGNETLAKKNKKKEKKKKRATREQEVEEEYIERMADVETRIVNTSVRGRRN